MLLSLCPDVTPGGTKHSGEFRNLRGFGLMFCLGHQFHSRRGATNTVVEDELPDCDGWYECYFQKMKISSFPIKIIPFGVANSVWHSSDDEPSHWKLPSEYP